MAKPLTVAPPTSSVSRLLNEQAVARALTPSAGSELSSAGARAACGPTRPSPVKREFILDDAADRAMNDLLALLRGGTRTRLSASQALRAVLLELAIDGVDEAGDKIDQRIAEWAHARYAEDAPDAPAFEHVPARYRDQLRRSCEAAKLALSTDADAVIDVPGYLAAGDLSLMLDRPTLAELVRPFVDRAVQTLKQTLRAAGVGRAVEHILVVGGTSELASVRERLEEEFPDKYFPVKQPEWAVAQGASAVASSFGRDPTRSPYRLLDEVGLKLADDTVLPLVRPGDKFDDQSQSHSLGIVEDTSHAELVFCKRVPEGAVGQHENIGYMSVPMQGFDREQIELRTRLTRDLTLEAWACARAGIDRDARVFPYEKLRFAYEIAE